MPRLLAPGPSASWFSFVAAFMLATSAVLAPLRAEDAAPQPDAAAGTEAESAEEANDRRMIEEARLQQAAEASTVADLRTTTAFRQTRSIKAPNDAGPILAFHPLPDGGLVIATGSNERYGERMTLVGQIAALFDSSGGAQRSPPANRLIWLDASGAERHSAPLPFASKGVTVAPDGGVIAVGDDRVAVFSATGTELAAAQAPHVAMTDEEQAAAAEEIREQHREQLEMRRDQLARFRTVKDELTAIPPEDRTPAQKRELARTTVMVRSYEAMMARFDQSEDLVVAQALASGRAIHRVAASRDHLFLVARDPNGHGFGVWRCGRDFTAPEKIVGGLRGCCGQMDVQVIGDELVIAENARHQVAVYGFDGEPRRTFGEANRTDVRKGFGGCCNPMNACAGPDGSLLLSESSGLVKQFAADGTLIDVIGVAGVQPGCKNSSIGLSADGSTVYYLDIENGQVLVLEKNAPEAKS